MKLIFLTFFILFSVFNALNLRSKSILSQDGIQDYRNFTEILSKNNNKTSGNATEIESIIKEKQETKTNTKAIKGVVNALLSYYKREKEFNEKKVQFYLKRKGESGESESQKKEEKVHAKRNQTFLGISTDFMRLLKSYATNLHGKLDNYLQKNAGTFIRNNTYAKSTLKLSIFLISLLVLILLIRIMAKMVKNISQKAFNCLFQIELAKGLNKPRYRYKENIIYKE